jgi:hypothetical protein
MGRRYVLLDDYDGKELPEDTPPTRLTLGRKTYRLYLSDESLEALYAALEPFTKDADVETGAAPKASQKADRERVKAVRAWAIANKVKQPNGKPLGDRGRIPDEIFKAYDEAH